MLKWFQNSTVGAPAMLCPVTRPSTFFLAERRAALHLPSLEWHRQRGSRCWGEQFNFWWLFKNLGVLWLGSLLCPCCRGLCYACREGRCNPLFLRWEAPSWVNKGQIVECPIIFSWLTQTFTRILYTCIISTLHKMKT